MKTRILALASLVLVLACDKVERDWSRCSDVHPECRSGFSCQNNLCVPLDTGRDASSTLDGPAASADATPAQPPLSDAGPDTEGAPDRAADTHEDEPEVSRPALDAPADLAFDSPVGDGARTCGDDQDCPSDLPLCMNGQCVQCRHHDDCNGVADGGREEGGGDGGVTGGWLCNTRHQCVGCLSHADCHDPARPVCGNNQSCVACGDPSARENACADREPARPVCHAESGVCVQCTRTPQCNARVGDAGSDEAGHDGGMAGGVCSAKNTCVECNSSADCTFDPARPFCNDLDVCVGCSAAGADACTGAKPLCSTSGDKAGRCVECTGNAHCLRADAPICDANQCRACKMDSECSASAGLCALDGSCPMAHVITYVQNSSRCTSSERGQGTPDFPYCDLNQAISNIGSGSLIRVIGTVTAATALIIDSSRPLLIAGESAATAIINPAAENAEPLVSIAGGEVTLRDLTVSGGRAAGISASAGKLRVSRCYVLDNAGTGIAVGNGVAFDITNSVVARNGGTTGAGVSLGSYTNTSPVRFAFNTVVDNGRGGVVCAAGAGHTLTGILAHNNGVRDFNDNCIRDATSSTAPPAFGSNYHLTVNSPCVDAGGSACSAERDIDGESRPKGSTCDCGADEF